MATWRRLIKDEAENDVIIACTLTDKELDKEFDSWYGEIEGAPFTAWSKTRVYFPICYEGSEWVGSAPRNPCEEKTEHMGGV